MAVASTQPTALQRSDLPLAVSSNGRYMTTRAGRPLLLNGDSAWSLVLACDRSEAERYLDDRYASADNIIWMVGGDRDPLPAVEHIRRLVAGIRRFAPGHLFTAHVAPEGSTRERFGGDEWLALAPTYSYGIVHKRVRTEY